MNYAGFWRRFRAALFDLIFDLIIVASIFNAVCTAFSGLSSIIDIFDIDIASSKETIRFIQEIIFGWIYCAGMESSPLQGTFGKMAAGIKVTDLEGNRIGFGRATGRHFGKLISMLIFMIGFLMIPFTKKKQGLHDMMAGCLVVKDRTAE